MAAKLQSARLKSTLPTTPALRHPQPKSRAVQADTASAIATDRALSTTALKEWNVAIAALHRGEQTILLRKGGIREPVFKPPGSEFILFPTSFHSEGTLLKPGVAERYSEALALEPRQAQQLQLGTYVQVTGSWVTQDPGVLQGLDDLHIWTQDFVEARLKWRTKQPLTLLELRAWKLDPPISLQVQEDFFGCFSFVDVSAGIPHGSLPSLSSAQPALSDADFAAKQQLLRSKLASIQHTQLDV